VGDVVLELALVCDGSVAVVDCTVTCLLAVSIASLVPQAVAEFIDTLAVLDSYQEISLVVTVGLLQLAYVPPSIPTLFPTYLCPRTPLPR
jgi:hypothetical protein